MFERLVPGLCVIFGAVCFTLSSVGHWRQLHALELWLPCVPIASWVLVLLESGEGRIGVLLIPTRCFVSSLYWVGLFPVGGSSSPAIVTEAGS